MRNIDTVLFINPLKNARWFEMYVLTRDISNGLPNVLSVLYGLVSAFKIYIWRQFGFIDGRKYKALASCWAFTQSFFRDKAMQRPCIKPTLYLIVRAVRLRY